MSIPFYAGTFNPFTIGHKSIADRALAIFGGLVIGVGYNVRKPESASDAKERSESIRKLFGDDKRVKVVCYGTLTTEAAREAGADILLRGVRSSSDFEYERNIAEVNRRISGIETIIMLSLPEYDCVSSSVVRELQAFGADASQFLPREEERGEEKKL